MHGLLHHARVFLVYRPCTINTLEFHSRRRERLAVIDHAASFKLYCEAEKKMQSVAMGGPVSCSGLATRNPSK